uniref:Uncharacterized protein n=1 Tax=Solanum lycopersicum TaxID=4081 RepID=A0A494G8H7_SOLLC
MAYDYRPWRTYTVGRCWAWKVIIDLGLHTHAHTIGLRQPWQCYNRPWTTHTTGRLRALNVIIALGKYTWSEYVGYDMLSSPLESIHNWTMPGIIGYQCPCTSHTIVQFLAWHARMALRQHTWLDDVRSGMTSSSIDSIHGGLYRACYTIIAIGSTSARMMTGVTCHFLPWKAPTLGGLRHVMPSSHLESIYGWKTSGEACNHGPCPEHTVDRCWAW